MNSKLHQKKKRFIIKEINDQDLFEKTEETYLDAAEGPRIEETSVAYQADCGHMVGFYGPHELIARCAKCKKHLCHRCGNLRCRRCLAILCDSCARIVDEFTVYCRKCMFIYYLKKGSLFGLKGLHQFLSKEFSS